MNIRSHEVHKHENDYVEVILHLDPGDMLSEFATELGAAPEKEIHQSALRYVRDRLPQVKYKQIKVMIGGLLVATIVGTTLALTGGNTAQAAETQISAGPLGVQDITVGNFTAVVLNGRTQNTFSTVSNFNVTDATGAGAGWKVYLTATQFKSAEGNTLPLGSLSVSEPTVALDDPNSSPVTTVATAAGDIDTTTGLKLLSASEGGGMGTYTVSFSPNSLTLNLLPKDVKAGTYTSTITVSISSGP
ncbi:WxL domain-containing protein [Paenibacillus sp.]|uniref:WxL domain-containing protein n=1 Tax=Paenibacillus sp. TaxID=58172 RepID=UPI002D2918E7|nr:WxL domain-containing protein [Paenibacillus sp.]HZG84791.1 WxL domain-containing protein [Paenibacillus sp.]